MLEQTRSFLRRNRSNLAMGFGLAGAGYLAVQYVGTKLSEARNRMMVDRVARENIHRRFQQNQEDCTFTVQALLPTATENIIKELPVELLTQELQRKKAARIAKSVAQSTDAGSDASASIIPTSTYPAEDDTQSVKSFASESFSAAKESEDKPRKTKIQLWEEIKISSLTRSFTLLYTLSLLTLLTRVQLNLLGRKNYLSSVLSLAESDNEPTIRLESHEDKSNCSNIVDLETNRQYLMFSWWLLHRGWRSLMTKVECATKEVFGPLTPRDTISLGKFRELAMEVRKLVETSNQPKDGTAQGSTWLPYLLPPRDQESEVLAESGTSSTEISPVPSFGLRRLLDESSDLIDSPIASNVLTHMFTVGYDLLIDENLATLVFRSQAESVEETSHENSRFKEVDDTSTAKFASVLAALARQAHVIGNGSPNEYLKTMENDTQLEGLSALVYSSNFEFATRLGEEDKSRH
ncbi:Peroxin-3 [Geopyxis carbonaria]|nr:Peroxin-3 [Geopyxis carbonaria]